MAEQLPPDVDPTPVSDPELLRKLSMSQADINKAEGGNATSGADTVDERTAAFLTTRVAGGIKKIDEILASEPGAEKPTIAAIVAGNFGATARNYANTEARQRIEAAQLDILDAALTLGTGAAYTREQLEGYRQSYFPQLGDQPGTIADKQQRLKVVLESAKLKAGRAAPGIDEIINRMFPAGAPGQTPGTQTPPPGETPKLPGDIGAEVPAPPPGFSDEQAAKYDAWMREHPQATAAELRDFGNRELGFDITNAAQIVEERDKGTGVAPGASYIAGLTDAEKADVQKTIDEQGYTGALGAGAVRGIPFAEKALNAAGAVSDSLRGMGSFSERYGRRALMSEAAQQGFAEQYPGTHFAGEVAPALMFPSAIEGVGFRAMSQALRGGATRSEAIAAARAAVARQMGYEGAAYGAAQGASNAESPGQILPSAITGGVIGGVGGAALGAVPAAGAAVGEQFPALSRFVADTAGKLTPGARYAARDDVDRKAAEAARDLGIEIPKFVVGGRKAAGKAENLRKAGDERISAATAKLIDDTDAARRAIAERAGTPGTKTQMGEAAVAGGKAASAKEKGRIKALYTQAEKGAEGVEIPATKTEFALREIAASENEAVGGSKIGDVFTKLADDIADNKGGMLSVKGARKTRTNLRNQLVNDAGMTRSDATRLTNHVMDAISEDIDAGLKAAGKENVAGLFKQADRDWRELQALEDRYLEPYIGKEADKAGDEVAKALISDVQGRGIRLAKFLNSIPDEQAGQIRATLIDRLGRARSGEQGAAGDTFSLDTFLTNWNDIKESRNLVFDKDTVKSLNKLAEIAEAAKRAGKAREPSGRTVIEAVGQAAPIVGAGAGYGASDQSWKGGVIGGIAAPVALALSRGRAARLLTSPRFAEKLANTPKNPKAAADYWNRVGAALARTNPEISGEILGFRDAVLEAAGLAEAPEPELQKAQ